MPAQGKRTLKDYIRIKEAAKILGVSAVSLRRWDREDKLKAYKHPLTGYRLYLKKDLEDFLDKFKK